jgi:LysM repeat protein
MFTTRKALQLFVVLAVFAASFMAATPALAYGCSTAYTVVRGDTLRVIAANCGTTVDALRRANPEIGGGDLIYPGQVLLLPGAWIDQGNGYALYVIARGDTLKSLAIRFGTTVDALLSLNRDIYNANVIYEGQRLTVSSGGTMPPPPPSKPPVGGLTYTVQWGDTMRKIADRFGFVLADLIAVNPQISNPNWIFAGQVINLPASPSLYTVQRGDTLRIIAARFGTTVDRLLALNPQIWNANLIYTGQVIRIS